MRNGRIQRAIDESVIPDWLSFRCGEDGADDDWSCGAACGNLLRIARSRIGMSQRELAEAAGLPQSTIARIESGARQPSLPVLARILAAVELELRITVKDYDSHDYVLDANDARLTDDARLTGGNEQRCEHRRKSSSPRYDGAAPRRPRTLDCLCADPGQIG
ncbi:MAG: helix-turn-helix transcriptional regulator [Mycobacterium sp.]